jgi:hypothetical protein
MPARRQAGSRGMFSPRASIWEQRLAWVIMQPLGLPVVPEVKKSAASSSSGGAQGAPGPAGDALPPAAGPAPGSHHSIRG